MIPLANRIVRSHLRSERELVMGEYSSDMGREMVSSGVRAEFRSDLI